jgi:Flp pilus assembly protein CpaB
MEIEYRDDRHRAKFIVLAGVILALAAGIAAFIVLTQAQQQAGRGSLPLVRVVVAAATIPAREVIDSADLAVRDVPLDAANAVGVATKLEDVIGRVPAVSILQGQIVTTNMLASTTEGAKFSILRPDETISPDSEAWRAVSITVPDDLAVGGLLAPGETVDVFVTTVVSVPQALADTGKYVSERSTKVTYQDILILAREDAFYVVRVALPIAEEIAHLQASGTATFSLALRPEADQRAVDASDLGQTTNQIIAKYGLPIPEPVEPSTRGSISAGPIVPAPTPAPAAAGPESTPAPSASPVP